MAALQLEHQRGVDDVLAGRPPMHVARGRCIGLGDLGGERIDQRNGDVAGGHGFFAQRLKVVALRLGGIGDLVGGERWNDADGGLCACERDLEIEHALQPRAIVEDGAHGGTRDQRGQQRGGARGSVIGMCRRITPIAARKPPANPPNFGFAALAQSRDLTKALSPLPAKAL